MTKKKQEDGLADWQPSYFATGFDTTAGQRSAGSPTVEEDWQPPYFASGRTPTQEEDWQPEYFARGLPARGGGGSAGNGGAGRDDRNNRRIFPGDSERGTGGLPLPVPLPLPLPKWRLPHISWPGGKSSGGAQTPGGQFERTLPKYEGEDLHSRQYLRQQSPDWRLPDTTRAYLEQLEKALSNDTAVNRSGLSTISDSPARTGGGGMSRAGGAGRADGYSGPQSRIIQERTAEDYTNLPAGMERTGAGGESRGGGAGRDRIALDGMDDFDTMGAEEQPALKEEDILHSRYSKYWGTNRDGKNQGVTHFLGKYQKEDSRRLVSIAKRLGRDPSDFSFTVEGFENLTKALLDASRSGKQIKRGSNRFVYFPSADNPNKGTVIIWNNDQIGTAIPMDLDEFYRYKNQGGK
ncbi:hypothetical protein [Feifania hominis]|uniref:Uncharacterized protein n=1 Tax=Feifania hominis TaxID=2763660 RepID=A0A926DFI8_9FIRM|nr:hypothetical protein [Feifania hominis]MBC8537241.1 hypothetical protein [Feifania hominis]